MLNFNFPEKGLGLVFPPHFMDNFSKKRFLCYILWTDKISAIRVLQLFVKQLVTS